MLRFALSIRGTDMAGTAKEFLERWRQSYIYAEAPGFETLDNVVDECLRDAKAEGHSEDDLKEAAGGDLRAYIRAAVKKTSGE